MDEHRKHGWLFWLTVALIALPVLYVASFGPACWLCASPEPFIPWFGGSGPEMRAPRCYWPIGWMAANGPGPLGDLIFWYATRRHERIRLPTNSSGRQRYDSEMHSIRRLHRISGEEPRRVD